MAGIRDSKTVDGVKYNYLTLDGKVVRQTWGSNVLDIIYDNSGLPYALKYNGGYYIYVLNQQGDVIRIVNSTGATVAEYRYDAWGNVIYSNGSMAAVNPIRYRGYYYDTETGFYYLQSRYYDPSIGRFINADSFASTGQGFLGYNMFAYCGNNPVCLSDPVGTFWLYDLWNGLEDTIWKIGAQLLKSSGYNLTGDLLKLAASGSGNTYKADRNSTIAKKIASDEGFTNSVIDAYSNGINGESNSYGYTFPVSHGDLGAALHKVSYTFNKITDDATGTQCLLVTVTDTFDFTEFKNPFTQGSLTAGILWFANDIAYIDTKWGLLDSVSVEIEVVIPIDP